MLAKASSSARHAGAPPLLPGNGEAKHEFPVGGRTCGACGSPTYLADPQTGVLRSLDDVEAIATA